ncbi:MAG: filamentous hemagglutinin N-terminal domain-containing protein, partial [Candidatus Omnitrophica bacterium]|nr:filamentous hemagglutinin N-terminal domain-containing protein [Candidatus Omnitrophota bacterium]
MKIGVVGACSFYVVFLSFSSLLFALPQDPEVVAGEVTFEQDGNTLNVTASNNAIVNYSSFNIDQDEAVHFILPSADSVILNRNIGDTPSLLIGDMDSIGKVWLINTSGIYVDKDADINVGGLVASTLDISNENFLAGNYSFSADQIAQVAIAQILNEGTITAADGSYVVLIGGAVANTGTINAPLGTVAFAAGEAVTVGITDNNLISIAIDEAVSAEVLDAEGNRVTDQIKNSGAINAENGKVVMKAESLDQLFDQSINMDGYVNAEQAVVTEEGVIEIVGSGDIEMTGEMDAEKGRVEVSSQADVNVEGQYNVSEGEFAITADSITVTGTLSITGAASFSANQDIILSGNLAVTSGALTLTADADANGSGAFTQNLNTSIETIGSGDITIRAAEDISLQGITSAGALTVLSGADIRTYGAIFTLGRTELKADVDLVIGGNISVTNANLILTADADLNGTGAFSQLAGTTIQTIGSGDITITGSGLGTLGNITAADSLYLKQAGAPASYSQLAGTQITTGESLVIESGVTYTANDAVIQVAKDFLNNGAFIPEASTVYLVSDEEALVTGDNTFNDLVVIEPGKTVTFEADSTQTITGILTAQGGYGKLLTLKSSSISIPWKIDARGVTDLSYLLVQNATNVNIHGPPLAPAYSSNALGNTGWDFSQSGPSWIGSNTSQLWSLYSNWNGGFVPGAGDIATFSGLATSNTVLDQNTTIAGLTLSSDFTRTLSLNAN